MSSIQHLLDFVNSEAICPRERILFDDILDMKVDEATLFNDCICFRIRSKSTTIARSS